MKAKAILFVDDDTDVRSLMGRMLTRAGYFVVLASDGPTAIEHLKERRFDLIVTDHQMPGMSGIEFLKFVREKDLSNAPALMMSGVTDVDVRGEAYQLGVYDFISKPEVPEIILKRVENGLSIGELLRFRMRMQTEMIGAKKLHDTLFPSIGMPTSAKIHTRSFASPLMEIGGDCWDFFGDEDHTWFYLADITGHGVAAALFTSVLRLVFRRAADRSNNPGVVLATVNAELADVLKESVYVSAFCGRINLRDGKLLFANAGHPPPIARTGGRLRRLRSPGMWIGVDAAVPYPCSETPFQQGDWLYICTDGILEGVAVGEKKTGSDVVFEAIRSDMLTMQNGFARIQDFVENGLLQQDDCTQLLIWRE